MQAMELPSRGFDLEQLCHDCSELDRPPSVLLISGPEAGEHLLAVNLKFLEDGQLLQSPGLPLAGAIFDPTWGFSRIETIRTIREQVQFRIPPANPNDLINGDIYGYRFCLLEEEEIATVAHELARIRVELEAAGLGTKRVKSVRVSGI